MTDTERAEPRLRGPSAPPAAAGPLARAYNLVRPLLPFVLAGGLVAGLLLTVDAGAIRDELGKADLRWLPLILAANFASDWFRGIRWQHLLSPLGRPGVFLLFAASQIGSTAGLLLPLRAGEAVRVQIVRRRTGLSASSLVATLFSEVLSDLVTFSTYIFLGLLLLEEAAFLWPLVVAFGMLLMAGLAFGHYLARRVDRWPDRLPSSGEGKLRAWFSQELYNFAQGLQSLRDPAVMLHVTWSTQAIWLTEVLLFYACGRALGIDLSIGAYLLIVVGANAAGALPITPAGLGVFDVTVAAMLVALGVDEAQAAAYAIFVHTALSVPHITSGPLLAVALRISFSDIFSLRARPDVHR